MNREKVLVRRRIQTELGKQWAKVSIEILDVDQPSSTQDDETGLFFFKLNPSTSTIKYGNAHMEDRLHPVG